MVVMIDTQMDTDPNNTNDVYINNRKGNSICNNHRSSPGFGDEVTFSDYTLEQKIDLSIGLLLRTNNV